MDNKDRNFDGLSRRFRDNIYRRPKGQLRLDLCWRELNTQLPHLEGASLQVWDAGGGLGQMSARLAGLGHNVLYSDISQEMLAAFVEEQSAGELRNIEARQGAIQEMASLPEMAGRFDLIVCHAVLEWVEDQPGLVQALARCLQPEGYLSLMFYNLNTLVLSNITKGNLYKLRDEDFAGHPGGLTPSHPCRPHQVETWLAAGDLEVVARRGIRLVYDLMPRAIRDARSLEDVAALEWQYGDQEPFWALGRYVHLLCRPSVKRGRPAR
ncbi:methyltransferase domain-containing protein [Spongiibacter taiwanensis]|uniref:methyltransferase domain-containing protein n=1 Tax=Spongiibacter taiwanensis TaxID=1748242 RepID=UPI002036000A|nr:methyltransferase domain-containing protein [Spongiibacter taiwanensis]USA41978.1 methyltransferase domain-containing protein [Spongiibacter taiwanensis]